MLANEWKSNAQAVMNQIEATQMEKIKEVKKDFDPAALFLVHCGGRKLHIGNRVDEDFVAIKNAAGDVPFIVAFTFGEYGQNNHSGATIGGLSLSFTGFSE